MDESFDFSRDALTRKNSMTKKKKIDFDKVECDKSFYLFSQRNIFRIKLYKLSSHFFFETVILIVIVLSSIKLVTDTYMFDLP